jgi:hypothetical protein
VVIEIMCRLTVQTQSDVKTFSRAAFLLVVIVVIAGCDDNPHPYEWNFPTTQPGNLADLTFSTAEEDAQFQCLLSAATASADSRGLTALPVLEASTYESTRDLNALPVTYRAIPPTVGVYATWCKTVGSGAMVDADLSSCQHYLSDTLQAPDTEAIQIFAIYGSAHMVRTYGLRNIVIPSAEITGFKVDYVRNNYKYTLEFTPFNGKKLDLDNKVTIGSYYLYFDTANNIREVYKAGNSIANQLNQLSISSMQFKTTVAESLEALREEVRQYIDNSTEMDDSTKESAMATANMEIDRRIEFVNTHGEELYTLAIEQFSITNGCPLQYL